MLYRDYISWWLRPNFLRSWGKQSKTLFAGPWVGEFGWELMHWQGFVRKLSRQYSKTIISCRKGNEALYADFSHDFVFHQLRGVAECNSLHKMEKPEEMESILAEIPDGADHLSPLGFQPLERQEFIRYGKQQKEWECDIVFHPRGRNFGGDRNWSKENWQELLGSFKQAGLKLACIGLRSATLDLDADFMDYRDIPLSQTLDLMASAKLVLGPSSGPMHLASLCGTPHLVWTDTEKYAHGQRNRYKYEVVWNPFKTQAIVIDEYGFNPSVKTILAQTLSFFEKSSKSP